MPTDAEIEAAAKAMALSDSWSEHAWEHTDGPPRHTMRRYAAAALTAAEKVREDEDTAESFFEPDKWKAKHEARTQDVHTCHTDCPCQTGGEPVSDFVEARTQPETGQPIPDEAIEAGEEYEGKPEINAACNAAKANTGREMSRIIDAVEAADPIIRADERAKVRHPLAKADLLIAMLAHLEAAKDKRIAELEAALFECARLAGEDTSGGVPTKPPLTEWAIRAVKELRQDYDEVEQ